MGQHTFELKQAVVPESLKGTEVTYEYPDAVQGDLGATIDAIQRFIDPAADLATVLAAKFNGQGFHLDIQKALVEAAQKEGATAESLQAFARDFRLGTPRPKGEGKQGKVAKAEKRAEAAVNTVLDMYRSLNKRQRAEWRERILAMGGATEDELTAIDNEQVAA